MVSCLVKHGDFILKPEHLTIQSGPALNEPSLGGIRRDRQRELCSGLELTGNSTIQNKTERRVA